MMIKAEYADSAVTIDSSPCAFVSVWVHCSETETLPTTLSGVADSLGHRCNASKGSALKQQMY